MNKKTNIPNILSIEPTNIPLSMGKLLVSEPFLPDIYFRRAVILLIDYSEEGAIGVVLNKPTFVKISDISEKFNDINLPLFSGGPIDIENIYFLHKIYNVLKSGEKIAPEIFWGGNKKEIINYIKNNNFNPQDVRAFLGYSSWKPNQLEAEIKKGSWLVSNSISKQIFETNPINLWKNVVGSLGQKYKHWLNFPENFMLN